MEESIDGLGSQLSIIDTDIQSFRVSIVELQNSIDTTNQKIDTTDKKVATMNYASVSQIEGSKNVTLEAGKKGSVTVTINHKAEVSMVGIGALTVSSGYVVISGWNRNSVSTVQDEIVVDLYNTTNSAKTVTVTVEGRYVKSSQT